MVGESNDLHCKICNSVMVYDPLNRAFYCHQCRNWYGNLVQTYEREEDTRKHAGIKDGIYVIIAIITVILGLLFGLAGIAGAGSLCCLVRIFAGGALGYGGAKALKKYYNYNTDELKAVPPEYRCKHCWLPLVPDFHNNWFYCEKCGAIDQIEARPNAMKQAREMSVCKKCGNEMTYSIDSEQFECSVCD